MPALDETSHSLGRDVEDCTGIGQWTEEEKEEGGGLPVVKTQMWVRGGGMGRGQEIAKALSRHPALFYVAGSICTRTQGVHPRVCLDYH